MKKITATVIFIMHFVLAYAQDTEKFGHIRLPKNYVAVRVALPLINNFNYYNYYNGRSLSSTNLLGFGIGAFFKRDRGGFSLTGGFNSSFRTPVGDNFEKVWVTNQHDISSFFIDALHHRKLAKKISVIGGINFQRFMYNLNGDAKSTKHRDNGIGLTLGGELNLGHVFAPAILFRPVIIPLGTPKYYHTLSLAVNINAPVLNPGRVHGFK